MTNRRYLTSLALTGALILVPGAALAADEGSSDSQTITVIVPERAVPGDPGPGSPAPLPNTGAELAQWLALAGAGAIGAGALLLRRRTPRPAPPHNSADSR